MAMAMLFVCAIAFGQQKTRIEGDKVIQIETKKGNENKSTTLTYVDSKGKEYPIYISNKGRCFYYKKSKSGNEYKRYLDKETCITICKKLEIEYKE